MKPRFLRTLSPRERTLPRRTAIGTALLTVALSAAAQNAPDPPPMPPPHHGPRGVPFMGDDFMMLAAREMHAARVVKNAPYCADATTEHVQTLADGNHIRRSFSARLCRDAEGRTRYDTERPTPNGPVRRIFIHDPVAHESWLLDPANKTAMRLPALDGPRGGQGRGGMWHEYAQRMRRWARGLGEKMSGAPAPAAAASQAASSEETVVVNGEAGANVHLRVMRLGNDSPVPLPPQFGPLMLPQGQGEVQSLGSKDVEGVRAEGTRTTWTIPAGRIGNDKPIVITHEVWKSPDLLITLESRHIDPRRGENSYRVSNISRSAPSPDLFKVPAGYSERVLGPPPHPPRPPGPPAGQ